MSGEERPTPQPERWDAPNQQSVGLAPPWTEDNQGNVAEGAPEPAPHVETTTTNGPSLDEMTKADLLDYARSIGASPANHDMTKEEIRASIDQKLAEG